MNQGNAKKVKTVRFDDVELERIRSAAIRHHLSEAEVIRKVVRIGLVDLLDGEDEDELLRQRKADKSPDVDGQSFLNSRRPNSTFDDARNGIPPDVQGRDGEGSL